MKKRRSTAYMKTLQRKGVKYYFENPNTNIQDIADKFNITNERLSTAISKELKKRFDNSFDRRCAKLLNK